MPVPVTAAVHTSMSCSAGKDDVDIMMVVMVL